MKPDLTCYGDDIPALADLVGDFDLRSPVDTRAWFTREWETIAEPLGFAQPLATELAARRSAGDWVRATSEAGLTAFAASLRRTSLARPARAGRAANGVTDNQAATQASVLGQMINMGRERGELWRVTADPTTLETGACYQDETGAWSRAFYPDTAPGYFGDGWAGPPPRAESRCGWTTPLVLHLGTFPWVYSSRFDNTGPGLRWSSATAAPVDGAAYHFTPSHGRVLLGQVKLGRRAVLLAAIDDMLAVIHLAGRTRSILHIGRPHSFRELDVDRLLRAQGRARPRSQQADRAGPVRPPPSIEAEHHRIVYGLAVDVGTGPSIAQVLAGCFEDAADRARALKVLPARAVGGNKSRADTEDAEEAKPSERRARGKMWVRPVCRRFFRLAIRGHGNINGRISEIVDTLKFYFPDFNISCDAMSDVLNLLRGLGTCLVDREEGERIWTINLAGLRDPRSALHGRLCRETEGWHPLDAAEMAAIEGTDNSKPEPPTAATIHAAGVGAVRARVEAAPVLEVDIKAALEVLAALPPSAAPELLASTLTKPATKRRHAASAETANPAAMTPAAPLAPDGASPGAEPPAASVPAAAPVSAPSSAPTQEPGSEGAALRESAPEQGHVGDEVNIAADSRSPPKSGDVADVVDELHGLPPPAARTLLLGARVFSEQLEAATGHGAARDGVVTTSPDASPHGQPAIFPRRRLHLSPDHTLAVVAGVPPGLAIANTAQTRDIMLGLGHPVGDSPPGARASPSS